MEYKWPVYSIQVHWVEHNSERGLVRNSISFQVMLKEKCSIDELYWYYLHVWWNRYKEQILSDSKNTTDEMRNHHIVVRYNGKQSWMLDWFSHRTYPEDRTDKELKESFSNYVDEIQEENRELLYQGKLPDYVYCDVEGYRLMGADDHWRWKGPCHCKHCKIRGITRIDH